MVSSTAAPAPVTVRLTGRGATRARGLARRLAAQVFYRAAAREVNSAVAEWVETPHGCGRGYRNPASCEASLT